MRSKCRKKRMKHDTIPETATRLVVIMVFIALWGKIRESDGRGHLRRWRDVRLNGAKLLTQPPYPLSAELGGKWPNNGTADHSLAG